MYWSQTESESWSSIFPSPHPGDPFIRPVKSRREFGTRGLLRSSEAPIVCAICNSPAEVQCSG